MKKATNLKVRIDDDMKEDILDFCKKSGVTQSEFIRNLIKQKNIKNIKIYSGEEKKVFEEINLSLKKIGTNFNQIAHFLNLEHLKSFDNFKSIEDVIIIDKLKDSQINSIKNDLQFLDQKLLLLNHKLENNYERKT